MISKTNAILLGVLCAVCRLPASSDVFRMMLSGQNDSHLRNGETIVVSVRGNSLDFSLKSWYN